METGSWTARPGGKVITELHRRPYEPLMDRFLPRQAHHGGPVAEASANSFLSKPQLIQEKQKRGRMYSVRQHKQRQGRWCSRTSGHRQPRHVPVMKGWGSRRR